jgi:hypothetical protein
VLEVTPHFTSSAFSTYLGQRTLGRASIVIVITGVALSAGDHRELWLVYLIDILVN